MIGTELGVADLCAVQSLIADYVLSVDARDVERFRALWTDDAVLRVERDLVGLGAPLHGPDAIVAAFQRYFDTHVHEPGSFVRHLTTGSRIEIVGEDEVAATTMMLSVRQRLAGDTIDIRVGQTGLYTDRIVRTEAGWRLAERTIAWDPPERDGVELPATLYGAVPR